MAEQVLKYSLFTRRIICFLEELLLVNKSDKVTERRKLLIVQFYKQFVLVVNNYFYNLRNKSDEISFTYLRVAYVTPVSYTHLDVYKRQTLSEGPSGEPFSQL